MSVRNVIKVPNPLLKQKSDEVLVFDKSLKELVEDMFDTMEKNNGIGLAGVQIGILKRIIVIKIEIGDINFKSEIINPKILSFSNNKTKMEEGCLSVSGKTCVIERPDEVVVEYQLANGEKKTIEAKGLLAKCFQHEIDHLNGITILDREKEEAI